MERRSETTNAHRTGTWGNPGLPLSRQRFRLAVLVAGLITLTACSSGIGSNPAVPRATIRAYETEVADLHGQIDHQRATLAALSPPPPTPTPVSFARSWQIELAGKSAIKSEVGARDDLTPLVAEGAFLLVPVTVTNRTARSAYFDPVHSLVVVDRMGRTFDFDAAAWGAVSILDLHHDPATGPRQPGIAYPDVLVFNIAPDADQLVLRALDGSLRVRLDR